MFVTKNEKIIKNENQISIQYTWEMVGSLKICCRFFQLYLFCNAILTNSSIVDPVRFKLKYSQCFVTFSK